MAQFSDDEIRQGKLPPEMLGDFLTLLHEDLEVIASIDDEWPEGVLESDYPVEIWRQGEAFNELGEGKIIIYLDTNMWIDLVCNPSKEASQVLKLATELVTSNRAIFPVSYSLITEILHPRDAAELFALESVLQTLSQGLSIRSPKELLELDAYYSCPLLVGDPPKSPNRQMAFNYSAAYLAIPYLVYPEGTPSEQGKEMHEMIREKLKSKGLALIIQALSNAPASARYALEQRDIQKWVAQRQSRYDSVPVPMKGGSVDRPLLLRNARVYLAKHELIGLLRRAGISCYGMFDFAMKLEKVPGANDDSYITYFMSMPIANLSASISTERAAVTGRVVKEQDYFDELHLLQGLIYCDFFCSSDGGLVTLVRNGVTISDSLKNKTIKGMVELKSLLEQLIEAKEPTC